MARDCLARGLHSTHSMLPSQHACHDAAFKAHFGAVPFSNAEVAHHQESLPSVPAAEASHEASLSLLKCLLGVASSGDTLHPDVFSA